MHRQGDSIDEIRGSAIARRVLVCIIALFGLSLTLPAAHAAGARVGVHPKPGEMVILRDVPTRPAYRPAPPGMALIVDPKPNQQLDSGLDGMELSDSEAGAIGASTQRVTQTLNGTLSGNPSLAIQGGAGNESTPRGAATDTTPLGVVGNATRGVGSQITSALQALPLGTPPGGG